MSWESLGGLSMPNRASACPQSLLGRCHTDMLPTLASARLGWHQNASMTWCISDTAGIDHGAIPARCGEQRTGDSERDGPVSMTER
jgi:hypothetical protein